MIVHDVDQTSRSAAEQLDGLPAVVILHAGNVLRDCVGGVLVDVALERLVLNEVEETFVGEADHALIEGVAARAGQVLRAREVDEGREAPAAEALVRAGCKCEQIVDPTDRPG